MDRGRQDDALPPWARGYADTARRLGMGISTYRWLDSRMSGRDSARRAYDRVLSLGGPVGMAHVVDCEADADQQTLRDYVTTMTGLLGRPVALYSGRWWLQPRGWQVADLCPYLWAAPNAGYLPAYPGDSSEHWSVDYGGYRTLAAMQYAVAPLPGTGACSLSAIRDRRVWEVLIGEVPVPTYAQMQAERWYAEEIATPELLDLGRRMCSALGVPLANFGSKGDNQHLNGGHRSQAWIENSRWCTNRTYATESGLTATEKRWLSAFDITPATRDQMLRISQNVDRVTRAGQLEELVEWYGNTNDDQRVDGWDNIRNAVASSDSSHLWHLHGRFRRKVMRDPEVMDRVFNAVINGTGGDDDVNAEQDLLLTGDAWRTEALISDREKVAGGSGVAGQPNLLRARLVGMEAKVDQLLTAADADAVRDAAMKAVLDALAAGGTSVDTAAVIARINEVAAAESTTVAGLRAEVASLRADLAEAAQAAADAFDA